MALQVKYCVPQSCDCKELVYDETTGVYNVVTNPTGYGTPNPLSSAITRAVIEFKLPSSNYENSILFDFTIVNNAITAATRTNEFGNTTNVFSILPNTAFPFVSFEFDSVLLYGEANQSSLKDGAYQVFYSVYVAALLISQYVSYVYLTCTVRQCKESLFIDYTKGSILTGNAVNMGLQYDALLTSICQNNPTIVNNQISVLEGLCSPCNNC